MNQLLERSKSPSLGPVEPNPAPPARRLAAVDGLRGLVMVLMALDHASISFNAGRLSEDSAALFQAGSALPLAQFFTRWITHLCAPTFLFLAGLSVACSIRRRQERGHRERSIDQHLATRGLLIASLDPLMFWVGTGTPQFQVLFAIGVSLIAMVLVRRLATRWLLLWVLVWFGAGEIVSGQVWADDWTAPGWATILLVPGDSPLPVLYPVVPWLTLMMLGVVFGRLWSNDSDSISGGRGTRLLLASGYGLLAMFLTVRGFNNYGNMFLPRFDSSIAEWLHVSKYPPSLSFVALECGILMLALGCWSRWQTHHSGGDNSVLQVFGQTSLFFYILHRIPMKALAAWCPDWRHGGLLQTYAMTVAICVAMYPLCRGYRSYKRKHPRSLARFL